jgi:hypothetical protein
MQWIWPGRNGFRRFISQGAIDDWVLLVSATILVFAIAYVALIRSAKPISEDPVDGQGYLAGLRLRWLLVLTLPLLALTWQGRGALQPVAPGQEASREHYASSGLAGEFLVPLIATIGTIVLVRYGTRWLIPLFTIQGTVLVVAGTRSTIVTACLLSLFGAALCGVKPSRRQVAVLVGLVTFFTFAISATRAAVGREVFTADQGAGERIEGLSEGIGSIASARSREAILDDVVYRFDCNTYGAMVLLSLRRDSPPVGLQTLQNSLMLLVPSFLAPDKLSSTLETRNEEAFLGRQFGIEQRIDWLPSIFGVMLAWFGPAGLLVLAVLLGLLMAWGETKTLRRSTPARWVLAMGLAQGALLYSAGPQSFIILMRGPVLAAFAFVGAQAIQKSITSIRGSGPRSAKTAWPLADVTPPAGGAGTPVDDLGPKQYLDDHRVNQLAPLV